MKTQSTQTDFICIVNLQVHAFVYPQIQEGIL